MNSNALDPNYQDEKRKKKDQRRREVKNQRKNRIEEKGRQGELKQADANPQKQKEQKIKQANESLNRELIDDAVMEKLSFTEKISIISGLRDSLIAFPAYRYKQLKDLLKLCNDDNPDVVLKAVKALTDVFEDILPSYRIRQYEENAGDAKQKLSKDVATL